MPISARSKSRALCAGLAGVALALLVRMAAVRPPPRVEAGSVEYRLKWTERRVLELQSRLDRIDPPSPVQER